MKTTIYDLLGMIKDGNLVLEIVYKDVHYTWNYRDKTFYSLDGENVDLFEDYVLTTILNDEVIILATALNSNLDGLCQYQPYTGELTIPKPTPYEPQDDKIEKLDILKQNGKTYLESYCYNYQPLEKSPLSNEEIAFVSKINEIIDYIEKEK